MARFFSLKKMVMALRRLSAVCTGYGESSSSKRMANSSREADSSVDSRWLLCLLATLWSIMPHAWSHYSADMMRWSEGSNTSASLLTNAPAHA